MTESISFLEIGVSVAAAVILFIHALNGFSRDVQKAGGKQLERWLTRLTENPWKGFFMGAGLAALVQSSSAISGITVALVEAGTITFRGSLAVFLGTNVGTTSTAWLVTADATIIGPFLIVISAIVSVFPSRIALFGRAIFYLGVILLALELVGSYVGPLKDDPQFAEFMQYASNPIIGLLVGIIATALLQSSSVVVGVAIIAVQQGLLSTVDVVPVVIGSNLGTTSTALFAAASMGIVARRAALANLVFNGLGLLLFLPFMVPFANGVTAWVGEGDIAVAVVHLLFNIAVALIGAAALRPINAWLNPARQGNLFSR